MTHINLGWQSPLSSRLLLQDNTNLPGSPVFQLRILLGVLEVPLLVKPGVVIKAGGPRAAEGLSAAEFGGDHGNGSHGGANGKPNTHLESQSKANTNKACESSSELFV